MKFFNFNFKHLFVLLAVLMTCVNAAWGATGTVTWTGKGSTVSATSSGTMSSYLTGATSFTATGVGNSTSNKDKYFGSWQNASAAASTSDYTSHVYITFTVTSGYTFEPTDISFTAYPNNNGSGIRGFITDGTTTVYSTASTSSGSQALSFDLSGTTTMSGTIRVGLDFCNTTAGKNFWISGNTLSITGTVASSASSCTTNPTVEAGSNSSVTATTARVTCSSGISSLGSAGCSISSYGFVIGTSANPSVGGSGVTKHEVGTSYTTTGTSFYKDLTGLTPGTTYYVRPYATNGKGTAYGTQTSFITEEAATYDPDMSTSDKLTTMLAAKFGEDNRWTLTSGDRLVGKPSDVSSTASSNLTGDKYGLAFKAYATEACAMYDLGAATTIYKLTLKLTLGGTDGTTYVGLYADPEGDAIEEAEPGWEEKSAWTQKEFVYDYPSGASGVRYIMVFGNSASLMGMSQFKVEYAPTKTWVVLDNKSATSAGTANVTATYGANTNLTSSITAPTKTGYVFGGYFTAENGGGTQLIGANGAWLASKTGYTDGSKNWQYANPDLTLYAKWDRVYTLTYDANGGSVDPTNATQASSGASLILPTPVKTGYSCTGWYTATSGGTKRGDCGDSYTPSADETLHAQWAVNWKFMYSGDDYAEHTFNSSYQYTLELGGNTTYWFKYSDGGSHVYALSSAGTMNSGDCSGWWMKKDNNTYCGITTTAPGNYTFTITDDSDAGTKVVTSVTYPSSVAITVNLNGHGGSNYTWYAAPGGTIPTLADPTATGYKFKGWYTDESCTAGNEWDFSTTVDEAMTLYAKWINCYIYNGDNLSGGFSDHDMTESADGLYWYWSVIPWNANRYFKIKHNGITYDLDSNHPYFQCTDINTNSSANAWDKTEYKNCAVYYNGASNPYYILVYVPNTTINTTDYPKICASTFLPESSYAVSAGHKIYFDNSARKWENVDFRIGHRCYTTKIDMTKVNGTDNLYECTTTAFGDYNAFHIADNAAWTGSNNIYAVRPGDDDYDIDNCLVFQKYVIDGDITLTPGDADGEAVDGCQYYSASHMSGMKTDRVTISPYENGTITVNYTNTSNSAASFTSGSADLAHTVILTSITAVPATGYEIDDELTINESAYSADYVVTGPTTVAASFKAKKYGINYYDLGGGDFSGSHADGYPTTHTYDSETTLKGASKDNYTWDGWYTASDCASGKVTSLGATAYTASPNLYAKFTQTITLDSEGGSSGSESATAIYKSATLTTITNPTRSGYTFGGWYTGDDGTGTLVINTSGVLQANVDGYTGASGIWTSGSARTLYAKWTAKTAPTQYEVTIDAATVCSGSSTNIKMASSQSGVSYQLYKGEDKVGDAKEGGDALTWSSISATGTYKVMAVENATYAPREMSNTVTLSNYDAVSIKTHPTSAIDATVGEGSDMSVELNTGTFNNATYTWQTCTDATPSSASDISSGSQYSNYNTATMTFTPSSAGTYYFRCKITDDCGTTVYSNVTTVTATASVTTYSVTYAAGVTLTSGDTPDDVEDLSNGDQVTIAGNTGEMVYGSNVFRGWTDGTTFYLPGDKITISGSDVDLTAVWDEPVSDCKTWSGSPNTFTDGSMTVSTNLILTSGSIDNPSSVDIYSGTKATCFVIDGSSKYLEGHLNDGSEISSVTISAATNQSSAKKYAIVFSTSSDFSSTVTIYQHTAPSKDDARDDSKLIHEFTAPSGAKYFRVYRKFTYNKTDYGDGQTIRIYGVEVCKAGGGYTNFTVSFADGNTKPASHTTWPSNIVGVPTGKKILAPSTTPTATNYKFGGWYTNANCTTAVDFSTLTISADKTLYAKWTEKSTPAGTTLTPTASSVCSGSSTTLTLNASTLGVEYELYEGETKLRTVTGTGSALSLGSTSDLTAAKNYTVKTVENDDYKGMTLDVEATVSIKTATSVSVASTSLAATVDESFTIDGITGSGSGDLSYQWYSYTSSDGADEAEIDGAESDSYTFTPDEAGSYYFKCAVTGDCGTVKSNMITVTATAAKADPEVYTVSGTTSVCEGDEATITLSDSESGVTYHLYKGEDDQDDDKVGDGNEITWTVTAAGTYTVKVEEDGDYNEADMDGSAVISYKTATAIGTQPTTAVSGHDGVDFTLGSDLAATGEGTLTYQWYSYTSAEGAGQATVGSATTTKTITTSKSAGTYYYKVEVIATCGSVKSEMITVTVDNKHLLTYDANGGTGAPDAIYKSSGNMTLSSTEPTRDGYRFLGWNTEDDGTGDHYDAGGTYKMGSTAATLYAEWGETATLTWNLNVKTAESSIGTASKASTNARISNSTDMTNLANYGSLTITSSEKDNLTSKIETPSTYNSGKYLYVTFDVPENYEFVPTSISVKVQPVGDGEDKYTILDISDENNNLRSTATKCDGTSKGKLTTVSLEGDETALTGTVTLKIYVYNYSGESTTNNCYRLGSPITIAGDINYVCPERATITSPTAPQDIKLYTDRTKTLTVEATPYSSGTLHYQWKKDGVNIVGATSASHTVYGSIDGTVGESYVYTCEVTQTSPDACATVTSPAFTIKIASPDCGQNIIAEAVLNSTSTASTLTGGTLLQNGLDGSGPYKLNGKPSWFGIKMSSNFQVGDSIIFKLKVGDWWSGASAASVPIVVFSGKSLTKEIYRTAALAKGTDNTYVRFAVTQEMIADHSLTDTVMIWRSTTNDPSCTECCTQNHQMYSVQVKRYGCPDIFIYDDAAATHEWSDDDNWIGPAGHGSGLPTSDDRVLINESITVDTEDAAAAEVHLASEKTMTVEKSVTMGDVIVETGATLNVAKDGDDGIELALNSLSLKGGWNSDKTNYDMPRVYINPDSKITREVSTINFDISVDNRNYYPIALPFDVPLNSVDYAESYIAEVSEYGTHYEIDEYDGEKRAEYGGGNNNWKRMETGSTLKAGTGYILSGLTVGGKAIIRFPMDVDDAWLAGGEKGTATVSAVSTTKNEILVTAYVKEKGTTPVANKGWNLIGVPFMSCYTTSAGMYDAENVDKPATLIAGRFDYSTGKWTEKDPNFYVTVPTHDFTEFKQSPISEAVLMPGWCFFVQVEETGNLRFWDAQQTTSNSSIYEAPRREQSMPTIKTGIILSGNEASDKTTFLISDKYSAAEYEINADLEKMFGENGYTLATYSLSGDTRLAYNAMSRTDATNVIPIGYRAPAEGEYTFAINPRYAESGDFERIDLIDYETGFVTNLLQSSYTFTSDRTQSDSRFALNVVPQKETPTGLENDANDANGVRKVIIDNKIYIIRGGRMYDATGRMVK